MAPGRHSDFISSMSSSDLQGWQDSGGTQEAINNICRGPDSWLLPRPLEQSYSNARQTRVDGPKIMAPNEFPLILQQK